MEAHPWLKGMLGQFLHYEMLVPIFPYRVTLKIMNNMYYYYYTPYT